MVYPPSSAMKWNLLTNRTGGGLLAILISLVHHLPFSILLSLYHTVTYSVYYCTFSRLWFLQYTVVRLVSNQSIYFTSTSLQTW